MAQQTSILTFTGRLGKVSGFRRNQQHYLRSRPDSIHHTPNMKRSAFRFGRASSMGAFIRKSFNIAGDGGHVNRITKALIPAAGEDVSKLTGICFNNAKKTDAYFSTPPLLRKNGVMHIPAQTFPKGVQKLEIKLIAVRIDVQSRKILSKETKTLCIDTAIQFNGADLCLDVSGPGTLMIALSVNNSAEILEIKEIQIVVELPVVFIHTPHNPILTTDYIQRE